MEDDMNKRNTGCIVPDIGCTYLGVDMVGI